MLKDLDFQTIYEQSDDHSRTLYFNNCFFGYTTEEDLKGILSVNVGRDYLHGNFYYQTQYGDLATRNRVQVPSDRLHMLSTIPLMSGIHYENERSQVGFVTLIPERRASKGLLTNRLTGSDVFQSQEELYLFLTKVCNNEYSYTRWYTSRAGIVYCCGRRVCDASEFDSEMASMIEAQR